VDAVTCSRCNDTGYLDREIGDAATKEQISRAETLPNDELQECVYCPEDDE
jgi:hypothetical protein